MTVLSNDPRPAPVVTLTGTGIDPPDIMFDPTPVSFGDEAVGSSSTVRTIDVTNTRGQDVHIEKLASGDDFVVAQETCAGTTLPAEPPARSACSSSPAASDHERQR